MIDVRKLPRTTNGNGLHIAEPMLAQKGDSLVVKIDKAASEQVTVSKGTLAAIALIIPFIMMLFYFGSSLLGWTREDQQIRTKVDTMSKSIEDLNTKVDKLAETIHAQQIQSAKIDGFKAGVAETQTKEKK